MIVLRGGHEGPEGGMGGQSTAALRSIPANCIAMCIVLREREGRLEVSPASVGRAMGGDGRTIHSQAAPLSRPVDAGFVIFELSSFGEVQL